MLSMVFAAAVAAAQVAAVTAEPNPVPSAPAVAVAVSAPPPGAAPGARIFSYADLKAMDAKADGHAQPAKRTDSDAGEAHVKTIYPRQRRRSVARHTAAISAPPPAARPVAPKLRPAFAMKDGAKVAR